MQAEGAIPVEEATWGELLLVDDDPLFLRVLGNALVARGFRVRRASSVEEASGLLESNSGYRPDFGILDLNLAGSSGLKLIARLRSANSDCRIVILTGYASLPTAVTAIKLGADQYLSKPIEVDAIVRVLTDAGPIDDSDSGGPMLSMSRLEWEHIQRVLAECGGNISAAARTLKLHRRTLQRKLAKRPLRD
jgi:two-component system response regulator RegA